MVGAVLDRPCTYDITRHLDIIQDRLKDGWTVHTTKDGRLYYCNHITRTAGWLPPAESWGNHEDLPYGWEKAIDSKGRPYFINHLNKVTTYEAPEHFRYDEAPPEPRLVVLYRSSTMGFGFVAGSEKPVIVRFVTEGGPSVNKLEPGDQILAVNGEDVKDAPRDHVIQLVRSCENQVNLLVCQPAVGGCPGRKSTLLSAGKRAKLRTRPSRVRFAESVCVNGAPLFPPSAFSLGDLCVPPMANVLKVFLENGQTKSFKYDSTTTVQDVVTSLRDKLCLSAEEHFSLVLEHVKSLKRNKLTLLNPLETLARIAAQPGAHKLRCLFRITFVPVSAAVLAQKDLNALDYLYMQCCNDVQQERFAPELQPDVALRLAALHMHQHALANNISPTKLTVKTVEREFGLERFVPSSLIEGMKNKELRRLIAHFLKLNAQMTGSSTKQLTQLQAKIHYLDIISGLPSYGAKCFSTNQRDGVERVLLVSPRFGLSQIAGIRNSVPQPICAIEELTRVVVTREDDVTHLVSVYVQPKNSVVQFSMDDRDASEFSLVLAGYYLLVAGHYLPIERDHDEYNAEESNAPPYLSQHAIVPASWSYMTPVAGNHNQSMAFVLPPPYHECKGDCDKNMNTTLSNRNHKADEFGFDIHSVLTMDLLEGDGTINGLAEAKNEAVLRREMQRMVENSQRYLNEHCELECGWKSNARYFSIDLDSDCESLNSGKVSSNEGGAVLKHSDSLVLLAESINYDLNGMSRGLNENSENQLKNALNEKRQVQEGLSQLLNDFKTQFVDDVSESDSESTSSPVRWNNNHTNGNRTSFGLHSPDDVQDTDLKEYLRHLKEASSEDCINATDLSDLCSLIEIDPDVIDLREIPPPQTPDELDALSVLDAAPTGFDDYVKDDDLEKFLAEVTVAPPPPAQKQTPGKELTPDEIMSYIIPAPPPADKSTVPANEPDESLYSNAKGTLGESVQPSKQDDEQSSNSCSQKVFDCCIKSKNVDDIKPIETFQKWRPPPQPPERPPKSVQVQQRLNSNANQRLNKLSSMSSAQPSSPQCDFGPPKLPPKKQIPYPQEPLVRNHGSPSNCATMHHRVSNGDAASNTLHSPLMQRRNSATVRSSDTAEQLLMKTDAAMAVLLVKLDQAAAMCSLETASINEEKFRVARNELTNQAVQLVTASKMLVVAMSDESLSSLPEHLATCLTALRRITELTHTISTCTSSPLQTRNIVLKVHDVASSFRELAAVRIGAAGQLALNAECLANVLATLLRSLTVFSP